MFNFSIHGGSTLQMASDWRRQLHLHVGLPAKLQVNVQNVQKSAERGHWTTGWRKPTRNTFHPTGRTYKDFWGVSRAGPVSAPDHTTFLTAPDPMVKKRHIPSILGAKLTWQTNSRSQLRGFSGFRGSPPPPCKTRGSLPTLFNATLPPRYARQLHR